LKVRVEDVALITIKPKITQVSYQYAILTRDEYGHAKTFWVDVDKYDESKFIEAVKYYYAARYGIKIQDVDVEFIVKPPKVEIRK